MRDENQDNVGGNPGEAVGVEGEDWLIQCGKHLSRACPNRGLEWVLGSLHERTTLFPCVACQALNRWVLAGAVCSRIFLILVVGEPAGPYH